MKRREASTSRSAAKIVLSYIVVAAAWIFFSDLLLSLLIHDAWLVGMVSLAKGWVFVGITALLLYVLIKHRLEALEESHRLREEAECLRAVEGEERERRIRHVGRLYAVLSEINRAMVRRLGEKELLDEVCRVLVETAGFSLAWFGRPDPTGRVVPETCHGDAKEYMEGLHVSIRDVPEGQGLVGTALRSGQPAVCNETLANPRMAPWHFRLAGHNLNSAACFPVAMPDGQCGGLVFYSTEPDFFTAEEETLLREICEDIAYALEFAVSEARRAEAEGELSRERSLLRTLVRTIPDLVWLKDGDGIYLACNSAFEKFFGAPEKAILGHNDYDFRSVEEADFFRAMDREAVAAGKPKTNEEWVENAGDDRKVLLETTKTPMTDSEGRLIGVLGIARDITAARGLQNALLESEERFRRLVKLAPVPLAFVDHLGRVVYLNDRFIKVFGYTFHDLPTLGDWWRRALPSRRYRHRIMKAWMAAVKEAAARHADIEPMEYEVTCKDGTTRLVEVSGITIEDAFLATFLDVTERRRAEMERERTDRLESLGVLAGGIAHDFNNILTAVGGNISLARRQIGSDHPAADRLRESERALERATFLTRQLLTFSRGGAPVRQVVETGALIREVVEFSLQGSNCRAETDLEDGLWCLDADPGQIYQVMNNLLLNAVQAMPGGGTVTLAAANRDLAAGGEGDLVPGRYVELTVTDQGPGIPSEILPRIFDPYFTTKPDGSGIGLASAFSIVRRHGGLLSADSGPGRGSRFRVLLPAAGEGAEASGEVVENTGEAGTLGTSSRVLVMDDEEMLRELAVEMLQDLGYVAMACADGNAAVELYRQALEAGDPFAAVILDLTVRGGMGGKEAAERIHALDPRARLVLSTGYSVDVADLVSQGVVFSGVLMKPYDVRRLSEELERLLGADGGGR